MSTAGGGGKKGGPKGSKKAAVAANVDSSDRATPSSVKGDAAATDPDLKDDAAGDGDAKKGDGKGDEPTATTPKPPVSAAQAQRDQAQKALNLALKQEWTPLEQTLKQMEKMVAAGGEEVSSTPLAGVMDIVSNKVCTIFWWNLSFNMVIGLALELEMQLKGK